MIQSAAFRGTAVAVLLAICAPSLRGETVPPARFEDAERRGKLMGALPGIERIFAEAAALTGDATG